MNKHPQLQGLGNRQKTIKSQVTIVGKRGKHLGPRIDFAKVTARFEPSDHFEVVDLLKADEEARKFDFPDQFISGLLGALVTNEDEVFTLIRVILVGAEHDEIDSSPRAFFEAGRDAGRQLLELQATSN